MMPHRQALVCLCGVLFLRAPLGAQDERRIASPDGQLEFRLSLGQPPGGGLSRLAYQVLLRGKVVLDTSYLGIDVHNQEPLLGENAGMVGSRSSNTAGPPTMFVEFMQNGSLGRLITIETRMWNDGLAFRYVIPRSTPLEDFLIDDEATEFAFPGPVPERNAANRFGLPFVVKQEAGWVGIAESTVAGYPRALLARSEGNVMVTRLAGGGQEKTVYEGHTPWTSPWRIVVIGADRDSVLRSGILRELGARR